jgi:hypothetical protein
MVLFEKNREPKAMIRPCRQCKEEKEIDEFGFCSDVCHKNWQKENYGPDHELKKRPRTVEEMQKKLLEFAEEYKDMKRGGQRSI